jgi:hypothetical protein
MLNCACHDLDNELGDGVTSYPLYKHLAKELAKSFESGLFPRREELGTNLPPVEQSQTKEIEWDKLIFKTGFELSCVSLEPMHLSEIIVVPLQRVLIIAS